MPSALQDWFARIPLFASLAPDELEDLVRIVTPLTLDAGDVLFTQGAPGDAAYVVEQGRLSIALGGREVTTVGPGQVVGELSLIDGAPRSATATCVESGKLFRIDRAAFDRLRRTQRPVAFKVLRALAGTVSERIRDTNQEIARLLTPIGERQPSPNEGGFGRLLRRLAFWRRA